MDVIEFREFCLSLPFTEETTPFDEDVLVYKIGGKMYAYASMGEFTNVGVKCDPEKGVYYRETYEGVGHASHMSKVHWIGLSVMSDLPAGFIRDRIVDSYKLVISGIPKSRRIALLEDIHAAGFEI